MTDTGWGKQNGPRGGDVGGSLWLSGPGREWARDPIKRYGSVLNDARRIDTDRLGPLFDELLKLAIFISFAQSERGYPHRSDPVQARPVGRADTLQQPVVVELRKSGVDVTTVPVQSLRDVDTDVLSAIAVSFEYLEVDRALQLHYLGFGVAHLKVPLVSTDLLLLVAYSRSYLRYL